MKLFKELVQLEESAALMERFNGNSIGVDARPLKIGANQVELNSVSTALDGDGVDEARFTVSGNGSEFAVEVYFDPHVNVLQGGGRTPSFEMFIDGVDSDDQNGSRIFQTIQKLINYYMDNAFYDVVGPLLARRKAQDDYANDRAGGMPSGF